MNLLHNWFEWGISILCDSRGLCINWNRSSHAIALHTNIHNPISGSNSHHTRRSWGHLGGPFLAGNLLLWVFLFTNECFAKRGDNSRSQSLFTAENSAKRGDDMVTILLFTAETNFCVDLLWFYNLCSLCSTPKHGSSGPNLPLNLIFTDFVLLLSHFRELFKNIICKTFFLKIIPGHLSIQKFTA